MGVKPYPSFCIEICYNSDITKLERKERISLRLIGYRVKKPGEESEDHLERLKRQLDAGKRIPYEQKGMLLLLVDTGGECYIRDGGDFEEVEMLYEIRSDITDIPYFKYKGAYYSVSEFESLRKHTIGKRRRTRADRVVDEELEKRGVRSREELEEMRKRPRPPVETENIVLKQKKKKETTLTSIEQARKQAGRKLKRRGGRTDEGAKRPNEPRRVTEPRRKDTGRQDTGRQVGHPPRESRPPVNREGNINRPARRNEVGRPKRVERPPRKPGGQAPKTREGLRNMVRGKPKK